MDENFKDDELIYRAIYPPGHPKMFWNKDGSLSPAALLDYKGLSVDRGYYRDDESVVEDMHKRLKGCIVSLSVEECVAEEAVLRYLPSKNDVYHSELHGALDSKELTIRQRYNLSKRIKKVYMENENWFEQ
ncbi:hypothetical protein [Pseudobutyrivibrio ruminis]|uniref:Uncharacterized protein n=1 Tax=Pseudobutyrivibrio ruminis TaxID=46206 RepID=A0A2G3DU41_9FIRM|nr:hypothetical protein [Pseudobutyrivibrio ruminis]PHU34451.1 hypothetical protein CSX01_10070 [Pseudobutyrivibrio ruminis]